MNGFAIQLDELVSDAALFAMNSTHTWREAIEFTENEMGKSDCECKYILFRLVRDWIIDDALAREID